MSKLNANAHLRPETVSEVYKLPQAPEMSPDMVHLGVLKEWLDDEKLWIPLGEKASFQPLILCASQGYWINLIRVRGDGVMSRHRHFGPVHAITLRGRWYYLERDWIAEENSYVFEPAGDTHTLYVPPDVPEMIAWFHVTGGYAFVDTEGNTTGYDDVFSRIDRARKHYVKQGLGVDYVDKFIR